MVPTQPSLVTKKTVKVSSCYQEGKEIEFLLNRDESLNMCRGTIEHELLSLHILQYMHI